MSTTTINLRSYVNGQSTDLTSIKLQDGAGTYGVKRVDTGAVVVASGTSFDRLGVGVYQYVIDPDPAAVDYDYVIRIVTGGITYYYPRLGESDSIINHIYTIPTSSYYSSEAEVMRLLGEGATYLMTEDWEHIDKSPVWENILSYVDETIDQRVGQKYAHAELLENPYIRRRATILAAHMLSSRRGNPSLYIRERDVIMEELDQIRSGRFHVMGAVPRGRSAPTVRNYVIQPTGYHPQRVIGSKSTGSQYSGMDRAWEPYMMIY